MPSFNLVFIPFLIFIMMLSASGLGIFLSALAIQYRDIRHGIQFLAQILMYSAPVVWPLSLMKEKFGDTIAFWYGLYPMVGVIEGFRSAIIGNNPMPWDHIILGFISSLFLFFISLLYFNYKEKIFADVA